MVLRLPLFAVLFVVACAPKNVPIGSECKTDTDCGAGRSCVARACATSVAEAPTIASIKGNSQTQPGRINSGLVITGTNLATTSVVRMLSAAGSSLGDLVLGTAEASTVSATIPTSLAAALVVTEGAVLTLELVTASGAARQEVQVLKGEVGPAPTFPQTITAAATPGTGATLSVESTGSALTNGYALNVKSINTNTYAANIEGPRALRVTGATRIAHTATDSNEPSLTVEANNTTAAALIVAAASNGTAFEAIGNVDLSNGGGNGVKMPTFVVGTAAASNTIAYADCGGQNIMLGGGCATSAGQITTSCPGASSGACAAAGTNQVTDPPPHGWRCVSSASGTVSAFAICLQSY